MIFTNSCVNGDYLETNFLECQDILYLIHDVETLNSLNNNSAGVEKKPFQEQVNKLGYKATNVYKEQRNALGLVIGQKTIGIHLGTPLDYGFSNKLGEKILLDKRNLQITMMIDAKTGIIYGNEDKLLAFRTHSNFIDSGQYFDLMPKHECIVEIVKKMRAIDAEETDKFLREFLKWKNL